MTDSTCKCCGQTMPAIEGIEVTLAAGLRDIVEIVRKAGKHGISTDRLFNRVYADRADGGPLTGVKVLHVRISRINKTLRPQGWEIAGEHTGNTQVYGSYRLQRVQPRKDGRTTRWHLDDEYTCLLIMKDGENLIRMRDTRWYAPLGSLHERGLVKPIGNENYIISQAGAHALVDHERGLDTALDQTVRKHIEVNNTRVHMLDHMRSAVDLLSSAADIASRTTGQSKKDALRKIAHEVLERALEKIA